MSKDMANGGSTLQVGDILAEFFAKKIEEMEEAKPNKKPESGEAETSDSSDSDNTSEFFEKRRKKSKRKKHKHKKSKKKAKSRHSSRHKHKSHKRKHSCDESQESHRLKRYKSEESQKDTTVKDETTLPISSSSCSPGTLVITTELKSCDTGDQTTLVISCNSLQGNKEQQCSDHVGLQTIGTKDKEKPKIENLIAADVCKSDNNQHCDAARTGELINDNKGVELKNSCSDESCTDNVAGSTMVMSEPASASVPSLSDSGSVTVASNNTILETVSSNRNSSKTPLLVSNSLTLGAKSRGKIIIKDLSCCQILQKVSKKEKEKLDSLEEGEITSEEESDKPREESQSSDTPEEDTPFYNSDISKEKKSKRKKERHKHKKKKKTSKKNLRSRSIENERHHHHHDKRHPKTERPRSSSVDREPYDLREKIDKARLLKVAQKNVLMMIEQGTLPKGVKIDALRQEQLLAMKTGGKSVQEFTEFCRALSQKDDGSSSDGSQDKWNEEADTPFIHHPFKLREHHPTIKLNIKHYTAIIQLELVP